MIPVNLLLVVWVWFGRVVFGVGGWFLFICLFTVVPVVLVALLITTVLAFTQEGRPRALTAVQAQRHLADLKAGRPIPRSGSGRDDNSINQFATLALWAARRHDVKTDAILLAVEGRYRQNQNKDGSWGYVARDDDGLLKDATTCAGLIF